jgi:predicted MPP superfamily phosphohydrolase
MSDIHLNFLSETAAADFLAAVAASPHDGLLVGGDIAEGPTFAGALRELAAQTSRPVYFVLGNHDAYHGSLRATRVAAAGLHESVDNLHWLDASGVFALDDATGLLGHSSWGDGRYGDVRASRAMLNDWVVIAELAELADEMLVQRLQELGAEAAEHLRRWLPEALDRFRHVVVLTHVPPFAEVNMRGGRPIEPEYVPFYTCGAVGELLREAMAERTDRRMTVLSGHTHGGGRYEILPNLAAWTLGTQYGQPRVVEAPLEPDAEIDLPETAGF